MAKLRLERDDVEALKNCRPGDCELQVGGGFDTFHAAIDWKAPGYTSEVEAFVRDRMVAYVKDYQARGDAALVVYNDESKPVSLRDGTENGRAVVYVLFFNRSRWDLHLVGRGEGNRVAGRG